MKNILNKIYSSPYGRIARRLLIVGLAASITYLLSQLGPSQDPLEFVNIVLGYSTEQWLNVLKIGLGTGALAALDKLKREWSNI